MLQPKHFKQPFSLKENDLLQLQQFTALLTEFYEREEQPPFKIAMFQGLTGSVIYLIKDLGWEVLELKEESNQWKDMMTYEIKPNC